MYLSLWAITALCLSACNGGPDSSDSPESGSGGGNTSTPQPGEGGINVHAVYGDSTEICQVNDENGEVLGNTEEDILGLKPGQFNFALGDPDMTTLDGQPFHVTESGDYTIGSGAVEVLADEVIEVQVELELAPQYHCESHQCDWPYEGGTCNSMVDEKDQWIAINDSNELHGSKDDTFGGQYAGVVTLIDDQLAFDLSADPNQVIVDWYFNTQTLSFGYTLNNDAAQATVSVDCELR